MDNGQRANGLRERSPPCGLAACRACGPAWGVVIGCCASRSALDNFQKICNGDADDHMKNAPPQFVDHLVFRVRDLQMSERFYTQLLGLAPRRGPDSLMWQVGDTRLFFTKSSAGDSRYDKEQVGLNHLAFGLRSANELSTIVKRLDTAKVRHSGIKLDHYGNKEFVWLDDPDGIRIEFYVRPAE